MVHALKVLMMTAVQIQIRNARELTPALMDSVSNYDFYYDFFKNRKALPAAGAALVSARIVAVVLRFSGGVMATTIDAWGCPRFFPRFFYFSRTPVGQALDWGFGPVLASFSAISGRSRKRMFDHGYARMNADETEGREGQVNDSLNEFFIFRSGRIQRGIAGVFGAFGAGVKRFPGVVVRDQKKKSSTNL